MVSGSCCCRLCRRLHFVCVVRVLLRNEFCRCRHGGVARLKRKKGITPSSSYLPMVARNNRYSLYAASSRSRKQVDYGVGVIVGYDRQTDVGYADGQTDRSGDNDHYSYILLLTHLLAAIRSSCSLHISGGVKTGGGVFYGGVRPVPPPQNANRKEPCRNWHNKSHENRPPISLSFDCLHNDLCRGCGTSFAQPETRILREKVVGLLATAGSTMFERKRPTLTFSVQTFAESIGHGCKI